MCVSPITCCVFVVTRMSEEVLTNVSEDEDALAGLLFQRLSPMLVLRILPLRAFNHSRSKELYGSMVDDSTPGRSPKLILFLLSQHLFYFPLLLAEVGWNALPRRLFSLCNALAGKSQDQEKVSTISSLLLERYISISNR